MSFLTELTHQLKAMSLRWTGRQRLTIVVSIVLSVLSIVGIGYWAMTPHYVVLANQLSPTQAAEYVSALEAAGIAYQLNFAGSAVSVPQPQHNQARLALKDVTDVDLTEESNVTGSLWSDPAMNQARLSRQQESRLARTIQQMKPVRTATVHLTQARSSPFVREQQPARASVTLDLKPGAMFSSAETTAIVSLIAHSVENLNSENVTVLSTDGQLLSSSGTLFSGGLDGNVSGQLAYRTQLEANLAAKAENVLNPLLGLGNATVRVSAEIDFTETSRTQKTIDPDSKAKVREELFSESTAGLDTTPLGPPGTSSNLTLPPSNSKQNSQHESENLTTEYINGETTDLITELPGKILRLTVAAVVQLPKQNEASDLTGAGATVSGDQESTTVTKQEIESIIRNAVGFDEARGDEIEVVSAQLAGVPELIPPVGFFQNIETHIPLLRALSLGLASVVALLLGTMIIRRLRPVVVQSSSSSELSPEIIERLNDLSLQMKENPEVVTTVLASWLSQSDPQTENVRNAA